MVFITQLNLNKRVVLQGTWLWCDLCFTRQRRGKRERESNLKTRLGNWSLTLILITSEVYVSMFVYTPDNSSLFPEKIRLV